MSCFYHFISNKINFVDKKSLLCIIDLIMGEKIINIINEAMFLSKLLGKSNINWAFVGGVAVGIHGYIRATEDIDIIIDPDDLRKLDQLLKDHGYIIHKSSINFKDGFKLFRRVKIVEDEYFILDVLIPPEDFNHLLKNRIEGYVDDVKVYVITKKDLIKLKKQSGRKIDLIDIEEMEKK